MRTIHMPKVNQKNRPFGLCGILGEDVIDIISVKVGTADEAFQV